MSEPALVIRDRLIESLSYHGLGGDLEISLHEAADFGLMNGGMIVRAAGMYLELARETGDDSALPSPDQRERLIRTSFSVADHIASLDDRHGNITMTKIFGKTFVACIKLAHRVRNAGASPYEDETYPRVVNERDLALADALDLHMAKAGAAYFATEEGKQLIDTEPTSVKGRGCPLRYKPDEQSSELENVINSLIDEYFDPTSSFYGTGYPGMANFVLSLAVSAQPRNPNWTGHRVDWQLPELPQNKSGD